MDIFICHSWKDQDTAQRLADDLSGQTTVWLDTRHALAEDGSSLSPQRLLSRMDQVILLWSANSAQAAEITEELGMIMALGKPLLLCRLDDSPSPQGLPIETSIDLSDYRAGIHQLYSILVRAWYEDISQPGDSAPENTAPLSDEVPQPQAAAPEHEHWLEPLKNQWHEERNALEARFRQMNDLGNFIENLGMQLEVQGHDRTTVLDLLQQTIRREEEAPELLGELRRHLEAHLQDLDELASPPEDAVEPPKTPQEQMHAELAEGLQMLVRPEDLDNAVALVGDYLNAMEPVLATLRKLASQQRSSGYLDTVHFLHHYLKTDDDLLPASQYGIWGWLDDAWLVINSAYRLVEAGLVPADIFPVDWQRIATADRIVQHALPSRVHQGLEKTLNEILKFIAREADSYRPTFTHHQRRYRPRMGQASAVGGVDRGYERLLRQLEQQMNLAGWPSRRW